MSTKNYQCTECGELFSSYKDQCPECKTSFSIERVPKNESYDEDLLFDSYNDD